MLNASFKTSKKVRNYARRIIIIITLGFLSVHMTGAFINQIETKFFFIFTIFLRNSDSP